MISLQNYETQSKKSIARPFIRRDCFMLHQSILDNFIALANKEVKAHNNANPTAKRQKLTEAHRSLLQQIYFEAVDQYAMQLELFANSDIAPDALPIGNAVRVNTNNKDLAYRLSRSAPRVASTIFRRLERLKECGAIVSKLNHGTTANYDLYINPDLILLWDAEDENYNPTSKFLKGGESAPYLDKIAKRKPSKEYFPKGKNKRTIAVTSTDNVDNPLQPLAGADRSKMCALPPVERAMSSERTPEAIVHGVGEDGAKAEGKKEAREKDTQAGGVAANYVNHETQNAHNLSLVAAEYLYKYAVWLLWGADADKDNQFLPSHLRTMYGGNLWEGKKIHRPEELFTIRYLAAQYFSSDTSPVGLERQVQNMQNRLRIAHDYLNRQPYYMTGQWFVTPSMFFDQNNRNGFVGTYKWVTQAREWKEQKAKRSDYRKRMLKHLEAYLANPSVENFTRQLSAVKKAAPTLEAEFVQRATNAPMGKAVTKTKAGDGFQNMLKQVRECRLAKQEFQIVNPA
jgi:DNA-binding FrmR family transcriptional regulator